MHIQLCPYFSVESFGYILVLLILCSLCLSSRSIFLLEKNLLWWWLAGQICFSSLFLNIFICYPESGFYFLPVLNEREWLDVFMQSAMEIASVDVLLGFLELSWLICAYIGRNILLVTSMTRSFNLILLVLGWLHSVGLLSILIVVYSIQRNCWSCPLAAQ